MSKLLIDGDYYIPVQQSLAKALGNHKKAIILQQVYYWMQRFEESKDKAERKKHFRDGRWWVYNTFEEWKEQFSGIMGERQMFVYISELEKDGYLLVANYNTKGYDRTKWYSVDVDKVQSLVKTHFAETAKCNLRKPQDGFCGDCNDYTIEYPYNSFKEEILVPEKSSGDSEPLIDKKYGIPEDLGLLDDERKEIWIKVIKYHILLTEKWNNNKRHRKHKPDYWRKWISDSEEVITVRLRGNFSYELGKRIIDYYFNIEKPCGDGEFAALWNKKNLNGVLNKLYGGSRSDYEEAGMIEEKMEFHNSVRELEFV